MLGIAGLRVYRALRGVFSGSAISTVGASSRAGFCHSERRFGRIGSQIEADERLCCAHRRDQRGEPHDVDDAFEIVGQHVPTETSTLVATGLQRSPPGL